MPPVKAGHIDGHGAVHVDGEGMHLLLLDQLPQEVKQLLRPSHGKGRDYHRSATLRRGFHDGRQARSRVVPRVQAVAVGGLNQQIVEPVLRHHRRAQDELRETAEVPGEQDAFQAPFSRTLTSIRRAPRMCPAEKLRTLKCGDSSRVVVPSKGRKQSSDFTASS